MPFKESIQLIVRKCREDPTYYIRRYIQEVFEAAVAISIVIYLFKKSFQFQELARMSFVIGAVTLVLEEYDHEHVVNLKQGILFTIGANMVTI
jgi:hypothetical protein